MVGKKGVGNYVVTENGCKKGSSMLSPPRLLWVPSRHMIWDSVRFRSSWLEQALTPCTLKCCCVL